MKALLTRLARKAFFALLDWARKEAIEELRVQFCDLTQVTEMIKYIHVDRTQYVKNMGVLERKIRKVISATEREAGRMSFPISYSTEHIAKMRALGDKLIRLDDNLTEVRNAKRAILGLLD